MRIDTFVLSETAIIAARRYHFPESTGEEGERERDREGKRERNLHRAVCGTDFALSPRIPGVLSHNAEERGATMKPLATATDNRLTFRESESKRVIHSAWTK